MSTTESKHEEDLIDLNNESPIVSRRGSSPCVSEEPTKSLIDTELQELEELIVDTVDSPSRLQSLRRPSVDVEDILITIDDDDDVFPLRRNLSFKRCKSEELLPDTPKEKTLPRSISFDDSEALAILSSLDDILNAELSKNDDTISSNDEFKTQEAIEECLQELDDYFYNLDSLKHDSLNEPHEKEADHSSIKIDDHNLDTIKKEEVYPKFALCNSNDSEKCGRSSSLSALGGYKKVLQMYRSMAANRNKCRPKINLENLLQSLQNFKGERISETAGSSKNQEIDWVRDIPARDVSAERLAYASGDYCTGTVVVEPLRTAPNPSTSSLETMKDNAPNTWLRNSMRRLRHIRLPVSNVSDFVPQEQNQPQESTSEDASFSERPVSAPSRISNGNTTVSSRSRSRSRSSRHSEVSNTPNGRARSSSASSRSRRHRSLSSSGSSLASSVETTASCTPVPPPLQNNPAPVTNTRRPCDRIRNHDMPEAESPLGQWPHSLSSMLACLSCTLGLFNISRFAILTVQFGANFIFQFLLLSFAFGLPLLSLQMCLGQTLGAGVLDMWRISPLFQGVGVALLLANAFIGLYSIVGVSWMFVFFRDSFVTKMDKYRWAEPFLYYRDDIQVPVNGSYKLSETIPDYFNGVVLQRHHLATGTEYATIKFQPAFNLAVVWMIVFVSLSKGLRSYGKVIYVFTLVPIFGTFVLCAKILGVMPPELVNIIFPETSWNEFFLNPKSWMAAAQETFLTWGLLGAAIMQITSHNKHKSLLQRDSSLVAVITITILLLVAFLANTCVQILRAYSFTYHPDSFERINSCIFLRSVKDPLPPTLASTPARYMVHNSFIVGEKVVRYGVDYTSESGYQVLRLATELIPATFAALGSDQISPFWVVLFYFIVIFFGIAQQLAIWHCLITGIMAIKAKSLKSWETTITFFSCSFGFLLGLPMATEYGIYVIYFMDYVIGGFWWLIIIILLQIVAIFMVRGRPYSGDAIVTALFTQNNNNCVLTWAPALLSFTWNVILPVALVVLCISTFKNGNFREMFIWHHVPIAEYWPLWVRQIGSLLQLFPVLCVPFVAVVQSYRYLNNGPSDILERIQLLYRPPIGEHMENIAAQAAAAAINNNTPITVIAEDPPPKYTPPPSYTTATGARIAKFLRQSIRRSVRRLANVLGEGSSTRTRAALPNSSPTTQPPPPDYNAVLVEMNNPISLSPRRIGTLERLRNLQPSPGSSIITAAEVASILRSSFRRSTIRRGQISTIDIDTTDTSIASLSAENLIHSAAPISETSLVLNSLPQSNSTIDEVEENKSLDCTTSSVI